MMPDSAPNKLPTHRPLRWKSLAIASACVNGILLVIVLALIVASRHTVHAQRSSTDAFVYQEVFYNNRKFTIRTNRATGEIQKFNEYRGWQKIQDVTPVPASDLPEHRPDIFDKIAAQNSEGEGDSAQKNAPDGVK